MRFVPSNPTIGGPRARIVGRHPVRIESVRYGPSKYDAQANCYDVEMTITDGEHRGRRLWAQYFTSGKSDGKLAYDNSMLGHLARAVGLDNGWDVDDHTGEVHELRGKDCDAEIGPKQASENDEVKRWIKRSTSAALPPDAKPIQVATSNARRAPHQTDFSEDIPF